MKKDKKQLLFEAMNKIDPSFPLREEEIETVETTEDFTGAELEVLYTMAHSVQMNGYIVNNPLSLDIIYDYNQKHGNIIKFPLKDYDEQGLYEEVQKLFGEKAVDDLMKATTPEQATAIIDKHLKHYEERLRAHFAKNSPEVDDTMVDSILKTVLGQNNYKVDNLRHSIRRHFKYPNAEVSTGNRYNNNFYEHYPFAAERKDNDYKTIKYTSDQMIEIAKSLVRKKAIIVIPYTEEEKQAESKMYGDRPPDYLTPDWGHNGDGYAHLVLLENPQSVYKMYNDYMVNIYKLTKQDVDDLIITAFEGGSNYWVLLDLTNVANVDESKYISEIIAAAIWSNQTIPVYDKESGDWGEAGQNMFLRMPNYIKFNTDNSSNLPARNSADWFKEHNFEKIGELSASSIQRGVDIMRKKYPNNYLNIVTDNYDAIDADMFFQLMAMGEVVYG